MPLPQRKHEGLERDLAALEDKVMVLGQEATRLCGIHDDHQDQIKAKNAEILDSWKQLTAKAQVWSAGQTLRPSVYVTVFLCTMIVERPDCSSWQCAVLYLYKRLVPFIYFM